MSQSLTRTKVEETFESLPRLIEFRFNALGLTPDVVVPVTHASKHSSVVMILQGKFYDANNEVVKPFLRAGMTGTDSAIQLHLCKSGRTKDCVFKSDNNTCHIGFFRTREVDDGVGDWPRWRPKAGTKTPKLET